MPGARPAGARAIITQTGRSALRARSTSSLFPAAEVLFDGRNSLRQLGLPERIAYHGVGVPAARPRRVVEAAAR